jgi:hypothetical protein
MGMLTNPVIVHRKLFLLLSQLYVKVVLKVSVNHNTNTSYINKLLSNLHKLLSQHSRTQTRRLSNNTINTEYKLINTNLAMRNTIYIDQW